MTFFSHAAPKLTERQQQVFNMVQMAIQQTGAPPTRAEIAAELGFRSANAAEEHLQALARKGVIELVSSRSRGIRLKAELRMPQPSTDPPFVRRSLEGSLLSLPVVGRVAAGSPILAQEHVEQSYHIEAEMFSLRPDYLLKVRGMSMRDAGIIDGDLLAVKQAKDAKNGQIVVARLGDEVTVKRFFRHRSVIELTPENSEFQTLTVSKDQFFEIEGWAVGLIRKNMAS